MKENRILSFGLGLLSGSIVGAALVMLLTPQSGSDLRQTIVNKYDQILESGRTAIHERRQALHTEYKAQTTRIPIPLDTPPSSQS